MNNTIIKYTYPECERCTHIEDCFHPDVDGNGHPIPPEECLKREKIILTKKT